MGKLRVNVCRFPTTTLFVDDNLGMLKEIHSLFKANKLLCQLYNNPIEALNYLNKSYLSDPFTNRCITIARDGEPHHFTAHFEIKKIYKEIYHATRFKQISVISIDQAMPLLNGLDLARQIQDEFSFKFMLTSETEPQLAIGAFNEDIIDKFYQKEGITKNLDSILAGVLELQDKYFLNLSEIASHKSKAILHKQLPSCLFDVFFEKFFTDLCTKNHIVEYYLIDEYGSFLLLDENGNPNWLILKDEKAMSDIFDFANDFMLSEEIHSGLQHKKLIPFFHSDEDWSISYEEEKCKNYLHPATQLIGKNGTYYYAYLPNSKVYSLERDKIVSYHHYFNQTKT